MRVGFASQDPRSPMWAIVGHGVREFVTVHGFELQLFNAQSIEEQQEAIETLIASHVDIILVAPRASTGIGPALQRALQRGIPVISLSTELLDVQVVCTVQSNNQVGAELAARHIVEKIGGKGVVAHLMGPPEFQDSIQRAEGFRRAIAASPGVAIAYEQATVLWEREDGRRLMREALAKHPDLKGVFAANDAIALGALDVVDAAGRRGEVIIVGYDAIAAALMEIHRGGLSATINQSLDQLGRTAMEVAMTALRGGSLPAVQYIDTTIVTQEHLVEAALETSSLLPIVLDEIVTRGEELTRLRDEVIHVQANMLRELSTPVIPISNDLLIMPLIGTLDTQRAQQVVESLLHGIATYHATFVILDITGVPLVDTQVANALIQAARAVQLVGAQIMLSGIRPEIAQTLVSLGVDMRGIITVATLQQGVALAMRRLSSTAKAI